MKHQAIQYLALDVHQSTVVATLRGAQGDIILRHGSHECEGDPGADPQRGNACARRVRRRDASAVATRSDYPSRGARCRLQHTRA